MSWSESEWEWENDVAKEALTNFQSRAQRMLGITKIAQKDGKLFGAWRRETKNSTSSLPSPGLFPLQLLPWLAPLASQRSVCYKRSELSLGAPVEDVSELLLFRFRKPVTDSVHPPRYQAFPDRKSRLLSFPCREHYSSVISPPQFTTNTGWRQIGTNERKLPCCLGSEVISTRWVKKGQPRFGTK